MTSVNNVDNVLLVLREQLQRMGRSRSGKAGASKAGRSATPPPMVRLQALAALDQLNEDDLRRALVRALLTEEMGEVIAQDPAFQNVVQEVYRILAESDEGRSLMDGAARQLRAGA